MFRVITHAVFIVCLTLLVVDATLPTKFLRIAGRFLCNNSPVTNGIVYITEGPTLITQKFTELANATLSNSGEFDVMAGYFSFSADKRPHVQLTHHCGITNATCVGVFRYKAKANFVMFDSMKPVDLAVGQETHTTLVCT